eukprot:GHVN01096759.1.p1 GENE.GHVN01096759.1~~GHVN01096759.1.p1  ORF type:complete len:646 (+),score=56.38 GHVN01096759.1:213-2150(+)
MSLKNVWQTLLNTKRLNGWPVDCFSRRSIPKVEVWDATRAVENPFLSAARVQMLVAVCRSFGWTHPQFQRSAHMRVRIAVESLGAVRRLPRLIPLAENISGAKKLVKENQKPLVAILSERVLVDIPSDAVGGKWPLVNGVQVILSKGSSNGPKVNLNLIDIVNGHSLIPHKDMVQHVMYSYHQRMGHSSDAMHTAIIQLARQRSNWASNIGYTDYCHYRFRHVKEAIRAISHITNHCNEVMYMVDPERLSYRGSLSQLWQSERLVPSLRESQVCLQLAQSSTGAALELQRVPSSGDVRRFESLMDSIVSRMAQTVATRSLMVDDTPSHFPGNAAVRRWRFFPQRRSGHGLKSRDPLPVAELIVEPLQQPGRGAMPFTVLLSSGQVYCYGALRPATIAEMSSMARVAGYEAFPLILQPLFHELGHAFRLMLIKGLPQDELHQPTAAAEIPAVMAELWTESCLREILTEQGMGAASQVPPARRLGSMSLHDGCGRVDGRAALFEIILYRSLGEMRRASDGPLEALTASEVANTIKICYNNFKSLTKMPVMDDYENDALLTLLMGEIAVNMVSSSKGEMLSEYLSARLRCFRMIDCHLKASLSVDEVRGDVGLCLGAINSGLVDWTRLLGAVFNSPITGRRKVRQRSS